MDTTLKVSISLCTYNRAYYLPFAIESILKQTYKNWELLILDDASTDDTEKIIQPYLSDLRINYIKQPQNLGITKNRNSGLSKSKGEYIAVLDSDDVWIEPRKLEQQIEFLEQNPDYAAVGSNMFVINETGKTLKKISYALEDKDIRNRMLIRNQIAQSSVVFRKLTAAACGNYDEQVHIWEDWDLWLKLGQKGKLKNLPIFALGYREHTGKISHINKKKGVETSLEIIYKYRNFYPNYILGVLKLRFKLFFLFFNLQ